VPIDRTAVLKSAEKLLRQGKLNPAIAEYLSIVEEHPRDWSTANILGDLYVRAKQIDKAIELFVGIADGLNADGFLPKASAVYKKILKIKPDHEHSQLQVADIASSQGLLADARSYFNAVADRRRARGDSRGVAQIAVRLASLDPADVPARLLGARARLELKDSEGALRDFKALASELLEQGLQAEAVPILEEAVLLGPDDPEILEQFVNVQVEAGNYERAREYARTGAQLKELAARFEAAGRADEALVTLADAARLDPSDTALRAHLVRAYAAKGDHRSAAEYLTAEIAGDDPPLLLTLAEARIRDGHTDEGMAVIRRVLDMGASLRQEVAMVGWAVAEQLPDIGFQIVDLAAAAAAAQSDWASAAAALQEFVTRVPNHVPALQRLVEVCVDGALGVTMYAAQAQLADAYITAGAASEARFIAEDLIAREPWDRANIERFRRALVLAGEPDPDAIIAERLSGEAPFMSTDLTFSEELPGPPPTVQADAPSSDHESEASRSTLNGVSKEEPESASVDAALHGSDSLEDMEIDLSVALETVQPRDVHVRAPAQAAPSEDLDGVFARLRADASRRSSADEEAEGQYAKGAALYEAGKFDEALSMLETASRSPRHRFVASSLVAQIYRRQQMNQKAIDWFERAAQVSPPTAEDGRSLLYELADALEAAGETSRALAICMELYAEAGSYRDVSVRVDRLAKVQAQG